MTGAAAEIVITEYPFPATSDLPHDLMPDASGTIVITGMMTHQMYALDPATGVYTTTPIPVPFANPRALARFDPETETFREYELPIPDALPYIVRVHPTTGWICAKPPN
jgi:streptogramin lyase